MNVLYRKNLKGFSLIELLVVLTITACLLAILYPSLSKARQQAKILVVNQELNQIGLALEAYEFCNGDWPPVRPDCQEAYSLPPELVKGGYLPGRKKGAVSFSDVDDKFYKGHSYRYMSAETAVSVYGKPLKPGMTLYVPNGFPANGNGSNLMPYTKRKESPVKWAIFSLGPNYDTQKIGTRDWAGFPIDSGFPVSQDFWYTPKTGKGILARIKMSNNQFVGTFLNGR